MKKTAYALFAALVFAAAPARADVVIKLGTLAPNGSPWHTLLKEMGQKWEQASGGKVKLRIYPGGVLGNEGDMVKKMRIGQLQAAALKEMQGAKMFCWEGDPASAEAWRAGGFHPVVMSSTDIVPGLQTGLID